MTTINISLPEPLKSYIDQQIDQGHYQTIDEYFCELIRQDQERQNLENLLLEGIASGEATEMTENDWIDIRNSVYKKLHSHKPQ